MALDVGDRRIGVAATDELGWTVQGLGVIQRKNPKEDIAEVFKYIDDYNVSRIVAGLPLRADGEVGTQAKKVIGFIELLKRGVGNRQLDIVTWDESMTTEEAHEILAKGRVSSKKRKKVVDKLAAVFILESYLRGQE